jgi:hypothetical protein
MQGETKMTTKSQPRPTRGKRTHRRYDVSALAREHGLDVPVLLSQKVWQACVPEPTDSSTMDMAAELDNLLEQLAEVMTGDKEMDIGVEYELSETTAEDLSPAYWPLPVKLKAVCEETVSDYMVVTVYLATEAQVRVYITDVYRDDSGCLALVTPGRCGAVMVPKGA